MPGDLIASANLTATELREGANPLLRKLLEVVAPSYDSGPKGKAIALAATSLLLQSLSLQLERAGATKDQILAIAGALKPEVSGRRVVGVPE